MNETAEQIARDFIERWATAWNEQGAGAVARLYTPDAILVGYMTVTGRDQIAKLLQTIIDRGWTSIGIKVVGVRRIGDVILVANEYIVVGSGENAGNTRDAKSSHVLIRVEGEWLSAMHTAT